MTLVNLKKLFIRTIIPSLVNTDPYDGPNSFADKARLAGRYGSSFKRRNAVRWTNLGHRRPDFQGFWTLLRSARGTSTRSPIAPSQNPWKLRSYGSVLTRFGIRPLALATALAAMAMPHYAAAQGVSRGVQCGNRAHMVKTLGQRFKENRFAMGLASNVSLLEFFVSKSGSWTILSTRADGKTCVIAAGKSWVNMPVPLVGEAVVLQR